MDDDPRAVDHPPEARPVIGPHKNLQLGEYLFPAANIRSAGLHLFPEPIQKKPAGISLDRKSVV